MFALTEFTTENGATHAVLGSHREERWPSLQGASSSRDGLLGYSQPTTQATMPKGSVLVWTGWSIHGAGVNRSQGPRIGLNVNYSLDFLAQVIYATNARTAATTAAAGVGARLCCESVDCHCCTQEENQFLACPPHLARKLSPAMQQLLGYSKLR